MSKMVRICPLIREIFKGDNNAAVAGKFHMKKISTLFTFRLITKFIGL